MPEYKLTRILGYGDTMQLYSSNNGTNPLRVRLYLAEKGIELDTVNLDMIAGEQTKPDYLRVNSLGLLPSLMLDSGEVITESIAICRYLEELHPDPPLFGASHLERARVEMWNRRAELEVYVNAAWAVRHSHPFFAGKMNQLPAFAAEQRDKTVARLGWLNKELEDKRAYLAGDNFSVADITGFVAINKLVPAANIPFAEELEHVHRWMTRIGERPAIAGAG